MPKIAVIGTGYVGLVAAACLSVKGNYVIAIDCEEQKIKDLQKGIVNIFEPGLSEIVIDSLKNKTLDFRVGIANNLQNCVAVFIAVGTPYDDVTGESNLTYVYAAIDDIIANATNDLLIINKSTIPIGTNQKIADYISGKNTKFNFTLASNPEFLSQGRAVKDYMNPQRIVVGTDNVQDKNILQAIYQEFIKERVKVIFTDIATAELIKYAANSFLAMKVSYINEIAQISDKIGGNISDVSYALGLDDRIGSKFLQSGPGYGGSCFPKDSKALAKSASNLGLELPLISKIDASNRLTILNVAKKIKAIIKQYKVEKLTVLGIAFKAGTDDIRDAQSLIIIEELYNLGISITIYDPEAMINAKKYFGNKVQYAKSVKVATDGSDLVCILTEWKEFKDITPDDLCANMRHKNIYDCRNIYDLSQIKNDINYYSLGR